MDGLFFPQSGTPNRNIVEDPERPDFAPNNWAEIPSNIKKSLEIRIVDHMDEVLVAALALTEPGDFLKEGDHDFDEIYEMPPQERPVEVPAPPGVN